MWRWWVHPALMLLELLLLLYIILVFSVSILQGQCPRGLINIFDFLDLKR